MLKHQKESDETKLKILKAAKKEFADKGFNGARMSSIASSAGVNQALLHYHFESKENLYRSIFQNCLGDVPERFTQMFLEEMKTWDTTPELELCAAIYIMIGIHTDTHDDDIHRIFAREMAEGKGIIHEFVKKYIMPRIILFEGIIKNGVSKGIFEISNTMIFALNVVAFIGDFVHGEEFLEDTSIYESLYANKKETLYNYMIELAFKALKPGGRELKIPELDVKRRERLDDILAEISSSLLV